MSKDKEARLESWKEIAGYLERTERTVQRWAKQNGLPVYRITGSPLGKVFAYRHELDGWLHAHKNPPVDPANGSNGHFAAAPPGLSDGTDSANGANSADAARPAARPDPGHGAAPTSQTGPGDGPPAAAQTKPGGNAGLAGRPDPDREGVLAAALGPVGGALPGAGAGRRPEEAASGSAAVEAGRAARAPDPSSPGVTAESPGGSGETFPSGAGTGRPGGARFGDPVDTTGYLTAAPVTGRPDLAPGGEIPAAISPRPEHLAEAAVPDARTDARRFWPRRGVPLLAALALAALAGVAVWLIARPGGAGHPETARVADLLLEENALTARDGRGRPLWTRRFEHRLVGAGELLDPLRTPPDALNYALRDLDGDDDREILAISSLGGSPRFGDEMHCFDEAGRLRWSYRPGRKLVFGSGPVDDCYRFRYFLLDDLDGDGRTEIILNVYNALSFPSLAIVLGADGRVRGEYLHSGHLTWLVVEDLEGNGKKELLATGINNGYRQGILAVLDPLDLAGASPQADTPAYLCRGVPAGREICYLRFPVDCLNRATEPYGTTGNIMATREFLYVASGCLLLPDCPSCGHVIFRFSRDLALQDVTADGGYALYHRCLEGKGLLDHPYDPAELEDLRGVLYWNGQSFQETPARNLRRPVS